jgi:hypothetical protein
MLRALKLVNTNVPFAPWVVLKCPACLTRNLARLLMMGRAGAQRR